MATMIQMAGNGFGGVIQGNFGTYTIAADGTFTVDTRDAAALLALGLTYVKQAARSYTLPLAPAAATAARIVSSGALSNGSLAIANQPDTMRQVIAEVGTGTGAITAGTLTVVYTGNDGLVGTDSLSLATAASTVSTLPLSRGVVTVASAVVSGLSGGVSPWIRLSTTAMLAVPVDPGAVDFGVIREYDAGATIAVGTVSAVTLGGITPTTAPNATVTYSFVYDFVAPTS